MDTVSTAQPQSQVQSGYSYYKATKISIDSVIIESSLGGDAASNETGINDLYKGLSVTANEIVAKINDLLKAKLPNGVQSLKPEEVTPDATADRIVTGITSLYEAYAKQHPEMEGEDLLKSFMKEARSGVQQGYDDAFDTLDNLGAFQFDGVKDGVQQTKALIEEKLKAWEKSMSEKISGSTSSTVADNVSSDLLAQAGAQLNGSEVSVYV